MSLILVSLMIRFKFRIGSYEEVVGRSLNLEDALEEQRSRLLSKWIFDKSENEYLICICVEYNAEHFKEKNKKTKTFKNFLVAWYLSQSTIKYMKIVDPMKVYFYSLIIVDPITDCSYCDSR